MSFAPATQEVSNSSHIVEWQLLADVPEEALHALLTIARRRTFGRGEVVFHRGDPADSLNLIRKGRFSVSIATPLGDTAMLSVRGPGDAFGELALLGEPVRSATVSALEPAETSSIHRDDFERLRHEHPIVNDVLIGISPTGCVGSVGSSGRTTSPPTAASCGASANCRLWIRRGEVVVPLTRKRWPSWLGRRGRQ